MSRLLFVEKSAKMPSSCKGAYAYCAVLEVDPAMPADYVPPMISERARGVVRVVWRSHPYPRAGATERSGRVQSRRFCEDLIASGGAK